MRTEHSRASQNGRDNEQQATLPVKSERKSSSPEEKRRLPKEWIQDSAATECDWHVQVRDQEGRITRRSIHVWASCSMFFFSCLTPATLSCQDFNVPPNHWLIPLNLSPAVGPLLLPQIQTFPPQSLISTLLSGGSSRMMFHTQSFLCISSILDGGWYLQRPLSYWISYLLYSHEILHLAAVWLCLPQLQDGLFGFAFIPARSQANDRQTLLTVLAHQVHWPLPLQICRTAPFLCGLSDWPHTSRKSVTQSSKISSPKWLWTGSWSRLYSQLPFLS